MKNIYQLKIQVKKVKPSIYRTILVDEDVLFTTLHEYIQSVFGLMNYHAWEFSGKRKVLGNVSSSFSIAPKTEYDFDIPNYYAEKTKIHEILTSEKQKISYWYDFGDDWMFDITLQKIFPKAELNPKIEKIPFVLKSKGPMLLEDVGGIHFWSEYISLYNHLLENPKIEYGDLDFSEGFLERVIGYDTEECEELELFKEIITDLYEVDWKHFDIEENVVTL